jgi:hypothetical protein
MMRPFSIQSSPGQAVEICVRGVFISFFFMVFNVAFKIAG